MPEGIGGELGWWCPTLDAAGNGTTTLNDLTGNGRNATLSNANQWTVDGSFRYVDAAIDRFITIPNFAVGTTYSHARWINTGSTNNQFRIQGFSSATRVANVIVDITPGFIYFQHGTTAAAFNATGLVQIPLNQWVHIGHRLVQTSPGNFTTSSFVNGVLSDTRSFTGTLVTTSASFIVPNNSNATNGLPQLFDDLRFYLRGLTNDEFAKLASKRGYEPGGISAAAVHFFMFGF